MHMKYYPIQRNVGCTIRAHIGPRALGRRSRLGAATGTGANEAICPRRRPGRSSLVACLGRQSQARKFQQVKRHLYSRTVTDPRVTAP